MDFQYNMKERCCALFLVLSLFVLQLSAITLSPHRLSSDLSSKGLNTFINTVGATGDKALPSSGSERMRNRTHTFFAIAGVLVILTERLGNSTSTRTLLLLLNQWNVLIGHELTALPQADMVARK